MQIRQTDEKVRYRRDRAREAVSLASQGRWEEAVDVNNDVLRAFPSDTDALNRLGKALSQLGRYSEARGAFQRSLDHDPVNPIARKNLHRLAHLEDAPVPDRADGIAPRLFIEESGKSCVTTLWSPAPAAVLARVAAGDAVTLNLDGAGVGATTAAGGAPLGRLEPRLAARLARLMPAGNRYAAAVASVRDGQVAVVLREVYRDPRVGGVLSFPTRAGELDANPPSGTSVGTRGRAAPPTGHHDGQDDDSTDEAE
jgi:tetratricopeptide (TPR) repeat protein